MIKQKEDQLIQKTKKKNPKDQKCFKFTFKLKDFEGSIHNSKINKLFSYIHDEVIQLEIIFFKLQEINYEQASKIIQQLDYIREKGILNNLRYFKLVVETGNYPNFDIFKALSQTLKQIDSLTVKQIIIEEELHVMKLDEAIQLFPVLLNKSFQQFQFSICRTLDLNFGKQQMTLAIPQNVFLNPQRLDIIVQGIYKLPAEIISQLNIILNENNELGLEFQKINAGLLAHFSKIQKLNLFLGKKNGIGSQAFESCKPLLNLKNLKIFIGANNEKSSINNFQSLWNFIQGCSQIQNLDLEIQSTNNLKEGGLIKFSNCLKEMKNLNHLKLKFGQFNNLKSKGLAYLGQALTNIELHTFSFILGGHNDISEDNASGLFEHLRKCKQLTSFEFDIGQHNKLGSLGIKNMGKIFVQMQNLRQLHLTFRKNNVPEQNDFLQLFDILSLKNNLQSLDISFGSDNQIGDKGAEKLSNWFINLNQLQQLKLNFLGGNGINRHGFYQIYKGIKNCPSIKSLIFNQIDDNVWEKDDFKILVELLRKPIFTQININQDIKFEYNFMDLMMQLDLDERNMEDLDLYIVQKYKIFNKFTFKLTSWIDKKSEQISQIISVFLQNTANIPNFFLLFGESDTLSPIFIYKNNPPQSVIEPQVNHRQWKETYRLVSDFFDYDFTDVVSIYIDFLLIIQENPQFNCQRFLNNLVTCINNSNIKKLSLKINGWEYPQNIGDLEGTKYQNNLVYLLDEIFPLIGQKNCNLESLVVESVESFYLEYKENTIFQFSLEANKQQVRLGVEIFDNFIQNAMARFSTITEFIFKANFSVFLTLGSLEGINNLLQTLSQVQYVEIGIVFQQYELNNLRTLRAIFNTLQTLPKLIQTNILFNYKQFPQQDQELLLNQLDQTSHQVKLVTDYRKSICCQLFYIKSRFRKIFRKGIIQDMALLFGSPQYADPFNERHH